jgi:hypothetical protein
MTILFGKPTRTFLILGILAALIFASLRLEIASSISFEAQTISGFCLLGAILWQFNLLLKKYMKRNTASYELKQHRLASYFTMILFIVHSPTFGENWNRFLYICFVLTVVTSIFSKSFFKYQKREYLILQYFLHSILGVTLVIAAISHAVIAVFFE